MCSLYTHCSKVKLGVPRTLTGTASFPWLPGACQEPSVSKSYTSACLSHLKSSLGWCSARAVTVEGRSCHRSLSGSLFLNCVSAVIPVTERVASLLVIVSGSMDFTWFLLTAQTTKMASSCSRKMDPNKVAWILNINRAPGGCAGPSHQYGVRW